MPIKLTGKSMEEIPRDCLVKLQAIYDSLKTAEKKAANLLIERPEFFSKATIIEAAQEAGCSEATLVRLAKRLGYNGYPQLKAAIAKGRSADSVRLYENITEDDEYEEIVRKVFESSIRALSDTMNVLDMNQYKKAVDTLCNAGRIVFCGVGDAAAVAMSGYQKFIRAGINAQMSTDPDVQLIHVSMLSKGDAVVVISHSGRTKSVMELVKHARAAGAVVISVTNFPVSPLAKHSDVILLTAAFSEHVKGEIMAKRVPELCVLESLFINVLQRKRADLLENLEKSNIVLEGNKL